LNDPFLNLDQELKKKIAITLRPGGPLPWHAGIIDVGKGGTAPPPRSLTAFCKITAYLELKAWELAAVYTSNASPLALGSPLSPPAAKIWVPGVSLGIGPRKRVRE
jgi:hypothetical protein